MYLNNCFEIVWYIQKQNIRLGNILCYSWFHQAKAVTGKIKGFILIKRNLAPGVQLPHPSSCLALGWAGQYGTQIPFRAALFSPFYPCPHHRTLWSSGQGTSLSIWLSLNARTFGTEITQSVSSASLWQHTRPLALWPLSLLLRGHNTSSVALATSGGFRHPLQKS